MGLENVGHGDLVYGLYSPPAGARLLTAFFWKNKKNVDILTSEIAGKEKTIEEEIVSLKGQGYEINKNATGTEYDRRISKGGLLGTAHGSPSFADRKVHFCLYGININRVVFKDKASDGTPQNKQDRRVTGAELRWIYRNRQNTKVQANILFWRKSDDSGNFEQCMAPWDSSWEIDKWYLNKMGDFPAKGVVDLWKGYKNDD
jgi:hypothetical protein